MREVERHRALWLFLETSNASLHCNYIGGEENWTATYSDVIGGSDDVVAHGAYPVSALLALRQKVGHYWGVEGGTDSLAEAPVPAVDQRAERAPSRSIPNDSAVAVRDPQPVDGDAPTHDVRYFVQALARAAELLGTREGLDTKLLATAHLLNYYAEQARAAALLRSPVSPAREDGQP